MKHGVKQSYKAREKIKSRELKKHVSTIHCVNSLSLLQRKVANALLFHAYDNLLTQEEHHIPIRYLCELVGYDSHDYKTIKRALVDLLSTIIEWNVIHGGDGIEEEQWNASAMIAHASIKGSICSYSYSCRMRELLYSPSVYGKLNILIQGKFKSAYGLALYENCVRYQNIQLTPWIQIEVFRKLMGVATHKYPVFRDFKRRVLDNALMEVNTISPLDLQVEMRKHKRQVVALRFHIHQKDLEGTKQMSSEVEYIETLPNRLLKRLHEDFGVTIKQTRQWYKQYGEEYIRQKMDLIEQSQSYLNGNIANLANYLKSALEHNYQAPKASKNIQQVKSVQQQNQRTQKRIEEEKQHQLRHAYGAYVSNFLKEYLQTLSKTKTDNLLLGFNDWLKERASFLISVFKQHGLEHKLVETEFRQFLIAMDPRALCSLMSFEEYVHDME